MARGGLSTGRAERSRERPPCRHTLAFQPRSSEENTAALYASQSGAPHYGSQADRHLSVMGGLARGVTGRKRGEVQPQRRPLLSEAKLCLESRQTLLPLLGPSTRFRTFRAGLKAELCPGRCAGRKLHLAPNRSECDLTSAAHHAHETEQGPVGLSHRLRVSLPASMSAGTESRRDGDTR